MSLGAVLKMCRYCLEMKEDMWAPRTCMDCHKEHVRLNNKKYRKRKSSKRSKMKKPVTYTFMDSRIKHPVFKRDAESLGKLVRKVMELNYKAKGWWSIDHIIPVKHPDVCGLTVSWNIQIITQVENNEKGNYFNAKEQEEWHEQWLKERNLWAK